MNKNILLEEKKDIDKSNIIGDATSDIELENDPLYGIKLDPSNKDFWNAANLILETENKNNVIYLTGKAGTGKTTLLKYLTRECKKMGKKYVTLAPTGVAAVNANGQTIHSFFHIDQNTLYVPKKPIPDKPFDNIFNYCKINENGWNLLKELDLIIIDEISMVPCNVIDLIDLILRSYRGNKKPFGGVQLLLIGDVFQLTPVMTNDDGSAGIIKMFYKDKFFFNAKVMEQFIANKNFISIELQKIYRQTDEKFINLLNNVRFGNVDTDVLDKINSKYNPNFDTYSNNDYIIITTKNVTANDYNNSKLEKLEGNKKKYEAIIDGEFPINMYPTKEKVSYIELKKGSQVMFIKNGKGFYNGLIGIIENLDEDEISVSIKISTNARRIVKVERYKWENVRFQL
ncbi:MAG: AAA family ATPase, partial [Bacteroidales bacterium]|nr:AAA family ATPase [Bacteroidales bacterium]